MPIQATAQKQVGEPAARESLQDFRKLNVSGTRGGQCRISNIELGILKGCGHLEGFDLPERPSTFNIQDSIFFVSLVAFVVIRGGNSASMSEAGEQTDDPDPNERGGPIIAAARRRRRAAR